MVANVKQPKKIPAVTHVDGTARLQTVSKESNPLYYDLINEFYKITVTINLVSRNPQIVKLVIF